MNKFQQIVVLAILAALFTGCMVFVGVNAAGAANKNPRVTQREYNRVTQGMSLARVQRILDVDGRKVREGFAVFVGCKPSETFCDWNYDDDGVLDISPPADAEVMVGPYQMRRWTNVCGRPVIVEFVQVGVTYRVADTDTYFPAPIYCNRKGY